MSTTTMLTLSYKQVPGLDFKIDVYAPLSTDTAQEATSTVQAPAVLFFHGGGLTVGNRKSWFPSWMHRRFTEKGYLFISADYHLIPPSTAHDIIEDIQDLWTFLNDPDLTFRFPVAVSSLESDTRMTFKIHTGSIAVAGVSAGGLCAYLCAMHCREPRPRAILSLYGMGGDFLTAHYLTPKTQPFFRGRELLDPTDSSFRHFLYPYPPPESTEGLDQQPQPTPTSDSPLSYHPSSHPTKPGYPSNPRMLLARLYLQLGTFLDYYTGEHEPSLSGRLREALGPTRLSASGSGQYDNESGGAHNNMKSIIGERHLKLFPQFSFTRALTSKDPLAWPPTALLHGTNDTAVPIQESRNLYRLLTSHRREKGQICESEDGEGQEDLLVEIPCAEHSFDLASDAEEKYAEVFDSVVQFIRQAVVARGMQAW